MRHSPRPMHVLTAVLIGCSPAMFFALRVGLWADEASTASGKALDGQIIIDPEHPQWLKRAGGRHVFICGPGDPEGFLYRGKRNEDGTRDGDQVAFKNFALRVHHSPGHTPGHILLEDEEHGLLWSGDQVMAQAIPNTENFYIQALSEPGDRLNRRPRFKGLVEMRKSLMRLRGQRFRRLLPGYGGIIERPERAIRVTLLFYDVRIQRIDRGLRHLAAMGQDVTAFELWQALYPQDESIDEMRTHLLTLIGALDCLEADGLVRVERCDSILTHRSSPRGRRGD